MGARSGLGPRTPAATRLPKLLEALGYLSERPTAGRHLTDTVARHRSECAREGGGGRVDLATGSPSHFSVTSQPALSGGLTPTQELTAGHPGRLGAPSGESCRPGHLTSLRTTPGVSARRDRDGRASIATRNRPRRLPPADSAVTRPRRRAPSAERTTSTTAPCVSRADERDWAGECQTKLSLPTSEPGHLLPIPSSTGLYTRNEPTNGDLEPPIMS